MPEAVLTLNSGSSSIKFSLFEATQAGAIVPASHGEVESIGAAPTMSARDRNGAEIARRAWPTKPPSFASLLEEVIAFAQAHLGADSLIAVGHRVVHGGLEKRAAERVTPQLLDRLAALAPLAPLHQPHNLAAVREIAGLRPALPQIVCYDTAFHATIPRLARTYGLPRRYDRDGLHRYGFHGLSYEFIARALRAKAPRLAAGRTIVAHLGNGASLCAMREGRSVDTTMGMTALDGLVMGTRCGVLDPGLVPYMERRYGLSANDIDDIFYNRSGLLGVSEISSDMRTLLTSDDARAKDAIDLFVFQIVKQIGALTSSLGGLDGLVFTAGIGENAAPIRAHVCERLRWLGVAIDEDANRRNDTLISAAHSAIEVRVIPTNEEGMIALHTARIVHPDAHDGAGLEFRA